MGALKIKTKAIIAAMTFLLASCGVVGYKIVKIKNYGGAEENLHKVLKVIDGDTFEIAGDDGADNVSVRILNISAPDRGECYFKESGKALRKLIKGKKVRLEKDVSGVDDFGRLARHVFLPSGTEKGDNILVGKYMVVNGFAKAIPTPPDFRYKTHYASVENNAIENDLGVWGNCKNNLPRDFDFAKTSNAQPTNANCVIKGNVSKMGAGKLYFLPTCPSYSQTRIDLERGEAYFCTEAEAQAAGFTKSPSCDNIFK